jgi:peptidoglycan hydrolase-like protein with peptidoglycan-binding domain
MWHACKTWPTWWRHVRQVMLISVIACVSACAAPARSISTPAVLTQRSERPALDRFLTTGDIHVVEAHLKDFGFDPGPVDGIFTAQTQAAVRAFQARYGLPVSGLLDRETRTELVPGLDPKRTQ